MPASEPPPHLFTYQHYRYCLSIESAWIIVPVLLAIFEFSAAEPGAWHRLALTAVGAVAGALSTALAFLDTYPWLRDADRIGARLLFGALLFLHGARHARQPCGALTPALVFSFYLASRWITSRESPTPLALATIVHLLFRFFGWWWVTFGIVEAKPLWWCALGSALYWAHIAYSAVWTTRGATAGFSAPAAFMRGLLEVAALSIALTAAAIVPPATLWMAAKRLAVVGVFGIVLAGQVVRAQQRAQRTLRRAKRA